MKTIPSVSALGNAFSVLENGYDFFHQKRKELASDVIALNLLGMEVICLGGQQGVELFYDTTKFQRSGVVPKRVQQTLTGEGAVHTLDDEKHRRRKSLFLAATTPESLQKFVGIMNAAWEDQVLSWEQKGSVILFKEAQQILTKAVCSWAGVPLLEAEIAKRADDFTAMVDAFGAIGPRHWRGIAARERTEQWITQVIENVRQGVLSSAADTPLSLAATHIKQGQPLDANLAAIELINLLRPTVAVSYFVTFAALAIHQYPQCRTQFVDNPAYMEWFALELRRFYPLAPFMGAIVRNDFEWQGFTFKKGKMVLLDIYGINHDEQIWDQPQAFRPERFASWDQSPFNYVPHGGGYPQSGHRCPGEAMTIETLRIATHFLVSRLEYNVPEQDLSFSLSRIPTYPESGFVIDHIRLRS